MSLKTVHVYIQGKVQGVFFRSNTRGEAEKLGVNGWVRNTNDGRVEALFEGEPDNVDAMVQWCHRGSSMADVKNVKVKELKKPVGCTEFNIKR